MSLEADVDIVKSFAGSDANVNYAQQLTGATKNLLLY